MGFPDHFSRFSKDYARHRPRYPGELFAFLAGLAPARELAWDCGTGSGQAALGLAEVFDRVVATDASTDQLGAAERHPAIEYRVEPAERGSLQAHSADLVTAATAVHWFDLEAFYAEARRVLKPQGVLAVWSYSLPHIDPQVDSLVRTLAEGVLQGYWPEQVRSLFRLYTNLPFPFAEVKPPDFSMVTDWDLGHLLGFIDSWSGAHIFLEREGRHPLESLAGELEQAWGAPGTVRQAHWPLFMWVGVQSADAGQAQTIVDHRSD